MVVCTLSSFGASESGLILGLRHPPTRSDQCHVHLPTLGTCSVPFSLLLRYILVNRCLYGLSVSLTTWLFRIFAHCAATCRSIFRRYPKDPCGCIRKDTNTDTTTNTGNRADLNGRADKPQFEMLSCLFVVGTSESTLFGLLINV